MTKWAGQKHFEFALTIQNTILTHSNLPKPNLKPEELWMRISLTEEMRSILKK